MMTEFSLVSRSSSNARLDKAKGKLTDDSLHQLVGEAGIRLLGLR